MASLRRPRPPSGPAADDRDQLVAVLDELEVQFLLDPDTTFETDPPPHQ
jgi:hypothetical protein